MEKYKQELINIKNYLKDNGVEVDEVTIWQGGCYSEGTKHGLTIVTRIMIEGKEEVYAIPKIAATYGNESKEQLKLMKL